MSESPLSRGIRAFADTYAPLCDDIAGLKLNDGQSGISEILIVHAQEDRGHPNEITVEYPTVTVPDVRETAVYGAALTREELLPPRPSQ